MNRRSRCNGGETNSGADMITLWGRNNSTNVKKVRWVLEELDLPYQQILAGLEFGLNHDPAYLAMNPNGLVPLLKDETTDIVLWESNTIIRYLAAQYGQDRLWVAVAGRSAQGKMDGLGQRFALRPSAGVNGAGENAAGKTRPRRD
jgi:glutathione S-transferase